MTELMPDPAAVTPSPAVHSEPHGFALDQRVYLFLVGTAFLVPGAALFFMALVDAPVTELAVLLLGISAFGALLSAAASLSGWRLARLAQQPGLARAAMLRASERRLAIAICALLLAFIGATLGCGVTLEFKGYGQDGGTEQDQAASWRRI